MRDAGPGGPLAPVEAFRQELAEAGPDALTSLSRFVLHLSDRDTEDLVRRIGAVLDDYTGSDRQRQDQPAYGGIFVLHRSPD